ncbi:hypothetical protein Y1Q_0012167 [Alligator mississippiensis]|uniref:Uncharacterized protein n=1 Tax=Alligator mississippiensis TaxID=8496 RepID=A0A151N5F6_ALLMI|nr:hypothetical protein Y1Q_0012167 [Alligator mississippiensis]
MPRSGEPFHHQSSCEIWNILTRKKQNSTSCLPSDTYETSMAKTFIPEFSVISPQMYEENCLKRLHTST